MADELDDFGDLAIVAPEEFVAARDALAKELKAAGEPERAAAVKKLRRPSVAQWLAAQVRHRHPGVVDALFAASRDVAAAQEQAIVKGDRDALRTASARRRDAVTDVERAVDVVLAQTDRPVHYRDEVARAIEDAVTDAVAGGTFGLRDDLELPEPAAKEPPRDRAAERRAEQAQAAVAKAEARVEQARAALDHAEADLARTREKYGV
jgi:hypothetical protein